MRVIVCMVLHFLYIFIWREGFGGYIVRFRGRIQSQFYGLINAWEAGALVAIVPCATVHYGCDCAIAHIYQQSSIS